jgi:hypothetical protein
MGTAFNPTTIASGFRDTDLFNDIHAEIRTELGNMVNRTGLAPNAMEADFDLGSNRGLNFGTGINGTDAVNLNQVTNVATIIAQNIVSSAIAGGTSNTSGDPITFNYGLAVGSQGAATRTEFDLNTLFGVTAFTGLTVVVNGVVQTPTAYTVTNVTLVTFSESLNTDTDIMFIYGDLSPTPVFSNVNATIQETTATATPGQTVFTAPTYIIGAGQLLVHIDGVLQSLSFGDYTETTTTSITFDEAMAGGERIAILNITGFNP